MSNFNRGNEGIGTGSGTPTRKINIERNDLTDKSNGEEAFAMPDPEDDFWKPVIPGTQTQSPPGAERLTDYLYHEAGAGKIASACAKISDQEHSQLNQRYKLPKNQQRARNDSYLVKDSLFGHDDSWSSKPEASFSQRQRNTSPADDVDLLSFDEPSLLPKYPTPSHSQIPENRSRSRQRSNSPELLGATAVPTATTSQSSFDVLESSRKMLYEMFEHVPPARIDRILEECDGSVTRCTDLLLEYPQSDLSDRNMKNFLIREENEFRANKGGGGDIPLFGQKKRNRNMSGPSAGVSSAFLSEANSGENSEFGGILPNTSIRHSQTNYRLSDPNPSSSDVLVLGESIAKNKKTSLPIRTYSSVDSENYGALDDADLFVPIDGEDWFDFQLTPDFVRDLFNAYSEPGRLTVSEMTPDSPELKIRIPPKLAFKLYQMLALSMMQRDMDRERANSLSAASHTGSEGEGPDEDPKLKDDLLDIEISSSDLDKFLREEMKLSLRELQVIRFSREQIQNEMAVKLTLAKLKAVFPSVSEVVIQEAFERNGKRFEDTVRTLRPLYGNKLELSSLGDDFPGSEKIIAETIKEELAVLTAMSAKCGADDIPEVGLTAEDWRNKATKHHVLRRQYEQRGQDVARQGLSGALPYFSKMHALHSDRMLEANAKAASIIMDEFKRRHGDENVLDLHHLYVAEAVDALHNYLIECTEVMKTKKMDRMEICVITGRGNNSALGIPRIAPAIVAYLREHHHSFLELNGRVVVTLHQKERKFQY